MALAGTRLHLVELCSIAAPENVCKCSADEVARTCATVPRAQISSCFTNRRGPSDSCTR